MDGIQIGDVVVLLDDDEDNCVVGFEKYIGLAGEVVDGDECALEDDINVKFFEDDITINVFYSHTWYYDPDQLEVIGSIRPTKTR